MQKSLLTHIANNFITEYENVANSSISYLLNSYPVACNALKYTLGVDSVPSLYMTEVSGLLNKSRPDITGLDSEGNKSVIIEGKFWANLTEHQPESYMNELSANGKLLFLAPDKRISSLKIDINNRIGREDSRIVICSWNEFLKSIEIENQKEHNNHLTSDLYQLKELCSKMDVDGMPPLSNSDLDPMNGRINYQLISLLDECHSKLKRWDEADFNKMQKSSTKFGHGFYFKAYGFGCRLYFSSHKWFVRTIQAPFWLTIQTNKFQQSQKISNALQRYDSDNSIIDENGVASFGIKLLPGMDKNQAINHIENEVRNVLSYLKQM